LVDSVDLNGIERQAIERAMRDVGGNKSRAARQLGISRTQLYMRLRKHGLERVTVGCRLATDSGSINVSVGPVQSMTLGKDAGTSTNLGSS
jgi:hypothetical protein